MQFEIPEQQRRKAKVPHEILLTNLVGNHILWFVAALGIFNTYWQPILVVPIVSFSTLAYTFIRAKKARESDDWFVMCHWQMVARRSKVLAGILLAGFTIACLGWVGYTYFGMMKVAVMAMVGGIGLLPVMVSVLVLIVMESDGMHQASSAILPNSLYERFPNADVVIVEDTSKPVSENT